MSKPPGFIALTSADGGFYGYVRADQISMVVRRGPSLDVSIVTLFDGTTAPTYVCASRMHGGREGEVKRTCQK